MFTLVEKKMYKCSNFCSKVFFVKSILKVPQIDPGCGPVRHVYHFVYQQ